MANFKHFNNDGAEYFKLHMMCPACLENKIPMSELSISDWVHLKPNEDVCGDMYIGDNGYYCCEKCLYSAPVINWQYTCPKHEEYGLNKYLSVTKGKYIAKSLSVSGQITDEAGMRWLQRVIDALIKQFGN